MTYYIKGGSRYNEANPKVWTALFLGGFDYDPDYLNPDWKDIDYGSHITNKDPYWRFGSSTGGAQTAEFGLYNDYRIEIDQANGVRAWNGAQWVDLLGIVDLMAQLGIGSANKQWMPCIFEMDNFQGNRVDFDLDAEIRNWTGFCWWIFGVPLASNRGSKKLYIDAVRIGLSDADGSNYISAVRLYAMDYDSGPAAPIQDGSNRTAAGEYISTGGGDMSIYKRIAVSMEIVHATNQALDLRSVEVRYYYDD